MPLAISTSTVSTSSVTFTCQAARGDKIVTTGGLTGTVVKVTDDVDTVDVEIAKGVKVQIVRAMIADVRGKNEPVKAEPVKTKPAK